MSPTMSHALPLAVQICFAGSRRLFGDEAPTAAQEAAVGAHLRAALEALPQTLALTEQHFVVGVSQLAAGADTLFTEALAQLGWRQRIFLPQLRDDFLAAGGSKGLDFQPTERERAARLFDSRHIVEETVVSIAPDRVARFEDTNLRLLDEADIVVCLRRDGAAALPGGTMQLMRQAKSRGLPVLELLVRPGPDGTLTLEPRWHRLEQFRRPALPDSVSADAEPAPAQGGDALPALADYAQRLKELGSRSAGRGRERFEFAAWVIVGTHVAATLLALLAMKSPAEWIVAILSLLLVELALLAWGFATHWRLHHHQTNRQWAIARLCAELGRSVGALEGLPVSPRLMQALPFPPEFDAVLRTMNVLRGHEGHARAAVADWTALREHYLEHRLRAQGSGQLPYYARQKARAGRVLSIATGCFALLSGLAFVATLIKAVVTGVVPTSNVSGLLTSAGGIVAAWLPVAAVGAMSMAAALDAHARQHVFDQMHRFLEVQAARVAGAESLRELAGLAAETETRLLGETLNWFARRAYANVA